MSRDIDVLGKESAAVKSNCQIETSRHSLNGLINLHINYLLQKNKNK